MIRYLFIFLAFILTAPLQAQTVPDGLRAEVPDEPTGRLDLILRRGTLIVGVKDDYPPWGSVNDAGDLIGLEADLAADLAARLGVDLELRVVTSSNRIGRVNDGIVDVIIATTADTEARRAQADVILPNYYSSGVVAYARADQSLDAWADMAAQPVCLNRGAYYNRTLVDTYALQGQYFSGARESRLALLQGRCVSWAFDDTALTQLVLSAARQRATQTASEAADDGTYTVLGDAILVTPWSAIVAKEDTPRHLARFVSDMVAEWHARGYVSSLQDKWNIPRTAFIAEKEALWSATDDTGRGICARDAAGHHPQNCLHSNPFKAIEGPPVPPWMAQLERVTGIDLSAFADPINRERLAQALWLTLTLSFAAIAGALFVGIGLTVLHGVFSRWGVLGHILLLPQKALTTAARMTPPILQLYIVYFGLGGSLTERFNFTPSNFLIAAVILSVYAGSTNAVILCNAYTLEANSHPDRSVLSQVNAAILRGFDGLIAACVNIVKAAGMASAIAVSEVISTINLMVAEGADTTTMMNGLLVFYFVLVLVILWLFNAARRAIVGPR